MTAVKMDIAEFYPGRGGSFSPKMSASTPKLLQYI